MSFTEPNEEYKIHLNLSHLADTVRRKDMFSFQTTSISGFINRIFDNYKENANASIAQMLAGKTAQWNGFLTSVPSDSRTQILEALKTEFINTSLQEINSYRLTHGNSEKNRFLKIRLNQKNVDYLVNDPACQEEIYYKDSIGKYLCAVIEEYSRRPFLEREAIYYKNELDIINNAIAKRRRLKVKLPAGKNSSSHRIIYIDPYKIVTDPQSLYHYLIGYSADNKETPELRQSYSYRISRFLEVRALSSQRAAISKEEKKQLEYLLQTKGAQFISGTSDTIEILLTPEGIRKYKSIQHLRPDYSKDPVETEMGTLYTFDCTQDQIEFYFFKFGADAEIVKPIELRKKFAKMYEDAFKAYEKATDSSEYL